jgi:hypothetical protein
MNLLLSTGMTFASDENVEVRSSGCGTLGSFVSNGIVQDLSDLQEVVDKIVPLCNDEILKVRIRAFWALGNVIEKLRMFQNENNVLADQKMLELIQVTIKGSADNEKVRSHALRTLGFLAELLDPMFLKRSVYLMSQVVTVLLKNVNSGAFKVRWNACYCLRHMLSNPGFPIGMQAPYSQAIQDTLSKALVKSLNFKVKIGAALALSTSNVVQSYQTEEKSAKENVIMILSHFVLALENIDQTIAKASYDDQKYISQFLEAIHNGVFHLKSLVRDDDLLPIENEINRLSQNLLQPKKSAFDSKGK